VAELEQKVQEENSMRFSLEVQVNKMRYELQVMKTADSLIMKNLSY
jgi:cell division protein FtsL